MMLRENMHIILLLGGSDWDVLLYHSLITTLHRAPHFTSQTTQLINQGRILNIPVFATTQNAARLGETCPELGLDAPDGIKTACHVDKSLFSMVYASLQRSPPLLPHIHT
jgi:hypothetical protein